MDVSVNKPTVYDHANEHSRKELIHYLILYKQASSLSGLCMRNPNAEHFRSQTAKCFKCLTILRFCFESGFADIPFPPIRRRTWKFRDVSSIR